MSLGLAGLLGLACRPGAPGSEAAGSSPPASTAPTALAGAPIILCVGTSLTAGYGLDPEAAFPSLLQQKLAAAGLRYRVVNAGVSAETSAGALRRLDWLMREPVAVLILETGANDGLRGQDPEVTGSNIQAILDRARRQQPPPRLVLAGMLVPPNYGADYSRRFRELFAELARKNGAALVPFLLEGVAGVPALNQADGVHPTAEGQAIVAENVWKVLRPLLSAPRAGSAP